uniref:O-GlcNAc transferase C-terminal domain-containing protein n=1 Tax=Heterosigma akashiwo TaxID=2829 RepID=A0A7S3XXF4_HETAK
MNGTLSKIPEPLSNEAGRLEDIESIKVEFGLQHCQRVFTSPQSLMKFSPDFDRVIEGILEGDQFACVVLLHDPRKGAWTKALQARQAGTVRAFARVIFLPTMPTEDFWRLLQASDLLLDPFPFGGGVTTLEAFAHCKAVLTAPGLQSVPALAGGMIRAANLAVLGSLYVGLSFKDLGLQQQQGQENGISQSIENNNHSSENDSGRKAERHAAHHQFTSEISNLHLVEEMVNTALSIGFNQTLRGEMERAVCSSQMEMAVFENNLVIQEWERMLLGMVKSSHTQ